MCSYLLSLACALISYHTACLHPWVLILSLSPFALQVLKTIWHLVNILLNKSLSRIRYEAHLFNPCPNVHIAVDAMFLRLQPVFSFLMHHLFVPFIPLVFPSQSLKYFWDFDAIFTSLFRFRSSQVIKDYAAVKVSILLAACSSEFSLSATLSKMHEADVACRVCL